MKTLLALAALLLATACGSADGSTATDPGDDPGDRAPTAIPAAPGAVTTRDLATVMDTGSPELCLGPVAQSLPPQCGGPAIEGWDWSEHRGMYEQARGTRWGVFAVTGDWDGATFAVRGAIPEAAYDRAAQQAPTYPAPAVGHSRAELQRIADAVAGLPGAQVAYVHGQHVLADVVYDDGSLQAWVDRTYGESVVVLSSLLVDEAD
jgi:hypothetical protein